MARNIPSATGNNDYVKVRVRTGTGRWVMSTGIILSVAALAGLFTGAAMVAFATVIGTAEQSLNALLIAVASTTTAVTSIAFILIAVVVRRSASPETPRRRRSVENP